MAECTHDCSTCGEACAERTAPQDLRQPHNPNARVGKVFGVVSGKGGVGKSMVTSQLAVLMHRLGHKTGVLDADVTGPSIPKAFGVHQRALGDERGMMPVETASGIQLMSVNLLLDDETDPVLWRGPVIGGGVTQFWTDVIWDVDYLFVDMPPGTGDVALSVFQSLPLDGVIIVAETEPARWEIKEITYDLHHDEKMNQGNIMTEYEERFSSKGNPIYKYIIRPCN